MIVAWDTTWRERFLIKNITRIFEVRVMNSELLLVCLSCSFFFFFSLTFILLLMFQENYSLWSISVFIPELRASPLHHSYGQEEVIFVTNSVFVLIQFVPTKEKFRMENQSQLAIYHDIISQKTKFCFKKTCNFRACFVRV